MNTAFHKTRKGDRVYLHARGISVRRSRRTILHGMDISARGGELLAVLGPSGCGKSTLLHALSGFRPPSRGKISLGGRDFLREWKSLRHCIGYVPQDDIVPTQLRVEPVLDYAARLRLPDLDERARHHRVEKVLRQLGLLDRRRLRVDRLSGGQRKRVSIAVELLAQPEILFADEPSSGLDPALEEELMGLFRRMADDGCLVVLTTHVMTSLPQVDRVVVLHEGHLVFSGPPEAARSWFRVEDFGDVYRRLGTRPGSDWAARWSGGRGLSGGLSG